MIQSSQCRRLLQCFLAVAVAVFAGSVFAPPGQAQTVCHGQLIIGFPNGDNLNRVIGQMVRMSIQISNGPSQDAGAPDNQVFTLVDFFPSCTGVGGAVCTPDPGSNPANPPALSYAGNLSQGTCPTLPGVNAANPFDIKFSLAPPYNFANGTGCTFSFDVLVNEPGSD